MSTWGKNNREDGQKKYWSPSEAKGKLEAYCAYQERCQWEVRKKLSEKGIRGEQAEELISGLITEGFLNEERFARAFSRGKFRMKNWGKHRIIHELKLRDISPRCIQDGLTEIDPEEYADTLRREAEKKWIGTREQELFKKRYQVIQYLIGKGFEQDLVQEVVKNLSTLSGG